jgi:hypothetical protein
MAMADSDGRTAESTQDSGSEESSMALASTAMLKEKIVEVNGKTASAFAGSMGAQPNIKEPELIDQTI